MTSQQIKCARKLLKFSQQKLADEIGRTCRQIQYLESGEKIPHRIENLAIECVLRRAKLWNAWSKQNG